MQAFKDIKDLAKRIGDLLAAKSEEAAQHDQVRPNPGSLQVSQWLSSMLKGALSYTGLAPCR